MKIAFLNIIILCLILSACEKRDWDNPFDPECPKILFSPYGLIATQVDDQIKLAWSQNNKQISKFVISRNANGGPWNEIGNTNSGLTTTFTDPSPIEGGVTYGYMVKAYAGTNPSNATQTTIIALALPVVTTTPPSNITANSVMLGGEVSSEGGTAVSERGIVYGTSPAPTLGHNRTAIGSGKGTFNKSITGLLPGTKYYVRAYAINSKGTSFGSELNFTTLSSVPTVTTNVISIFSDIAANVGGTILSNGGLDLTNAGVCYNTAPNPTTSNKILVITSESDTLTGTIKNLLPNTTYYVRAFAINSKGIAYGAQVSFKTDPVLRDIEGNTYKTVIIGDQVWMAENLKTTKYRDGTSIPLVTDGNTWGEIKTPAYCNYNNDINYVATYGRLYNGWAAIETNGICPSGWHVPSAKEWNILINLLGGKQLAGAKLKEAGTTHWNAPNSDATNESGFTALPGGIRWCNPPGQFIRMNTQGFFRAIPETGETNYRMFNNENSIVGDFGYQDTDHGKSVRCMKN